MDLHQAGSTPDWTHVPMARRSFWQRTAARTAGIVTPGNALSLMGFSLVCYGLWLATVDALWQSLLILAAVRLADIADGLVANRTATKGPVGEAIDATIDKLAALGAILILTTYGVVPLWIAVLLAAQTIATLTIALLARAHHRPLHPARAGKLGTAVLWISIGAFLLARLVGPQSTWYAASSSIGYLSAACAVTFGFRAVGIYYQRSFGGRHDV